MLGMVADMRIRLGVLWGLDILRYSFDAEGVEFNSRWHRHQYRERMSPTLKGSKIMPDTTLSESGAFFSCNPVAMPPAIDFVAFGDLGPHCSTSA